MNRGALALAFAAAMAGVFLARPHSTPGPVLRDFEAYYAAGATWGRGGDAYATTIWNAEKAIPGVSSQRLEVLPYVGVPQALPVFAAFARLSFPIAAFCWSAVLLAACALLLVCAALLVRDRPSIFGYIALGLFALGFGPLTSDIALGQVAALSAACVAAGTLVLRRGNAVLAGALALVSAVQPNLALALFSRAFRPRDMLILALAAATFLGSFSLLQPRGPTQGLLAYLALLRAHGAAERFALIQFTPASISYAFAGPNVAAIAGPVIEVGTLIVWLAGMRKLYRSAAASLAFSCALLPFALPFFHEHDAIVLVIPALYAGTSASRSLWPLALAGTLLVAVDWLGIAQRPDGWIQSMLLLASGAIAYTVFCRRDVRSLWIAGIAIIAIAGAALFAAHHPAPIWPDALGPHPALDRRETNVTRLWSDELRLSGQLTRDGFSGLLRSLTLLGSGLLAYLSWRCFVEPKKSSLHPAAGP